MLWGALAGGLMMLGMAPYSLGLAPILSCVGLLYVLKEQSPTKACWIGWSYGVGMFGASVFWIYHAIHDFGDAPPALAGLITSLFVVGMALYPALLAYILNRFFRSERLARIILAFPALWVLFEIIRGWFLTGFPWLYVGYAELGNPLRHFAPLGGVWLVSWVTVMIAALLYWVLQSYRRSAATVGLLAMIGISILAYGLGHVTWVRPSTRTLSVALVQGNIAQLMRWDPQHIHQIIDTYETLTVQTPPPELIVWPEGAMPLPLPIATPIFTRLGHWLEQRGAGLIAGVPFEIPDGVHFHNSLVGVGKAHGLYHKIHLVPFGEYVPLERWLRGLIAFFDLPMSSILAGPSQQSPLMLNQYRIAPAVCYEIAYPWYVQKNSYDSDFILTVSNDAWFGDSIGPAQHLQIAQMRALENGKAVLRATNTGWTAIIDAHGRILSSSPAFVENVLHGQVVSMDGQTPWNRWGPLPILIGLVSVVLMAIGLQRRGKPSL